jgi:hypothetical protein
MADSQRALDREPMVIRAVFYRCFARGVAIKLRRPL